MSFRRRLELDDSECILSISDLADSKRDPPFDAVYDAKKLFSFQYITRNSTRKVHYGCQSSRSKRRPSSMVQAAHASQCYWCTLNFSFLFPFLFFLFLVPSCRQPSLHCRCWRQLCVLFSFPWLLFVTISTYFVCTAIASTTANK